MMDVINLRVQKNLFPEKLVIDFWTGFNKTYVLDASIRQESVERHVRASTTETIRRKFLDQFKFRAKTVQQEIRTVAFRIISEREGIRVYSSELSIIQDQLHLRRTTTYLRSVSQCSNRTRTVFTMDACCWG